MASGDRTYIADKATLDEVNSKIGGLTTDVYSLSDVEQVVITDSVITGDGSLPNLIGSFTAEKNGEIRVKATVKTNGSASAAQVARVAVTTEQISSETAFKANPYVEGEANTDYQELSLDIQAYTGLTYYVYTQSNNSKGVSCSHCSVCYDTAYEQKKRLRTGAVDGYVNLSTSVTLLNLKGSGWAEIMFYSKGNGSTLTIEIDGVTKTVTVSTDYMLCRNFSNSNSELVSISNSTAFKYCYQLPSFIPFSESLRISAAGNSYTSYGNYNIRYFMTEN